MPYRRIPNTDAARIKALKTAIEKCSNTDFREMAISAKTLSEAKATLSKFERLYELYQQAFSTQVKANKSFQHKVKNCRMYLSHFIQVLYFCVIRSEIKSEHLGLYGLQDSNMLVPELASNEQLLEWGRRIIDGENSRTVKGGVPIYNPSIAKLSVMFSIFKEGYQVQQQYQKTTTHYLEEISNYRDVVDKVIYEIWEEVEQANFDYPNEERIKNNIEYGIVYYKRKGEDF
ncbi:MAG: hypothetical protein VB024_12570 [Dysgonamonadaceae bacterium]|jgi:hypothetical protein|nr:hypothetical protein [Dysgonamonadaceae bacterium]MDD3309624.1 hypothetical protein [Dysgonamonadaceae bacterium]MDD3900140.1 hypothetical protein [Dysgonamonadaceae bacterium]MDD4399598.1 hypothetical protein [Dysgonamonadaceae bacterium]MEA5082434.1 hypothetical protein [Dysgonamonadaceae bacterium]